MHAHGVAESPDACWQARQPQQLPTNGAWALAYSHGASSAHGSKSASGLPARGYVGSEQNKVACACAACAPAPPDQGWAHSHTVGGRDTMPSS
eukprot:362713-Chlamydomonas_euryale.AAC.5